jgi:hypothetical protein
VIGILVDALTSQAGLLERLGTPGAPSGEIRRLLGRAAGLTALLCSSSGERAKVVRELVEQVIVDEKRIIIKLQRGPLLGEGIPSEDAAGEPSGRTIELTAAVDFKRRGIETKLVPPGLAQQNQSSRGDPALIKAIARGRAWFGELATGRAQSLPGVGTTRRHHPALHPAPRWVRGRLWRLSTRSDDELRQGLFGIARRLSVYLVRIRGEFAIRRIFVRETCMR